MAKLPENKISPIEKKLWEAADRVGILSQDE